MEKIKKENIENSSLEEVVPDELVEYPSPNNPPWGILAGIGLWLFSVLMIGLIPFIFLTPYLMSVGLSNFDSADISEFALSDPTAVIIQLLAIFPAHLLTLAMAWIIVTRTNSYSFKQTLGWKWGGFTWWHTITIFEGLIAIGLCLSLVFTPQETQLDRILKTSQYAVIIVAIMATFSAPIVEEVVYRGVLYSALQRSVSIPIAVLLTTLIFAIVHFPQYIEDPATIIGITVVSLVLTMIRVKTNNLLPCIFFHFVFNAIQSVILIVESHLEKHLLEAPNPTSIESFFFFIK